MPGAGLPALRIKNIVAGSATAQPLKSCFCPRRPELQRPLVPAPGLGLVGFHAVDFQTGELARIVGLGHPESRYGVPEVGGTTEILSCCGNIALREIALALSDQSFG